MSDAIPTPVPASPRPRVIPVALRPAAERYQHVVLRLKERGGIEWTVEKVQALEKKVKLVRTMVNTGKLVAPILPTKFAEAKEGQAHHYRVLIAGADHTFIWSQFAKGLVSYAGPGKIMPVVELPKVEAPAKPIADQPAK